MHTMVGSVAINIFVLICRGCGMILTMPSLLAQTFLLPVSRTDLRPVEHSGLGSPMSEFVYSRRCSREVFLFVGIRAVYLARWLTSVRSGA
ncbi:hypothetical protein F5Y16DRAFT_266341 [Xylariaceae sp. FL0255]|nr:hypothetical protein F5Y16DRAFT_266341 [Xylariaceae sp. FL0255]